MCLDKTLQERGPCLLGLLAGHEVHGAGACRSLCVEAEFRHRGQPGHHARTCPLNRQGIAAAAHPHAYFSKGCSSTASCYCSNCGAVRRTQAHTHTHTHTLTCMRMRTHIQTQTGAHIHTGTHTHTHTHAQKHRHTRAHTHTHTCTHTRAHTHLHAHMHIHAHVARVMVLANFSASLVTLPHLSFSFSCVELLLNA